MSSPFGIPPPPPSLVMEPRPNAGLAVEEDDRPYYVPETDPWRRRAAVALAFFGVVLLVFANLATWVHFTALDSARAANAVAVATHDQVADNVVATVQPVVLTAVDPNYATVTTVGPNRAPAVTRAVQAVVASDAYNRQWRDAVEAAAQRQVALAHGAKVTPEEARDGNVLVIQLDPLIPLLKDKLVEQDIPNARAVTFTLAPYTVATTDTTADHKSVLGLANNLWWLLLLGAIACFAGAIYLASRPIRLATILCVDVLVMLTGVLLLVPLARQVVAEQAIDQDQSPLLESAYDALTRPLINQTLFLMVVAACTLIGVRVLARVRAAAERNRTAA